MVLRAIVVTGIALACAGCGAQSEPPEASESDALPDQVIMEFSTTESFGGDKSWKLLADKA